MELETQESTQESNQITMAEIFQYKNCIFRWVDSYLKALSYLKKRATEDISDDFVQSILLKAYCRKHQIRNKKSIKAWLYRLTINKCHDITRKKQRAKKRMIKNARFYEDAVSKMLKTLPAKWATVFTMRIYQNFRHKEIAPKLNIAESSSRAYFSKAKERLSKLLGRTDLKE